MSPVAAYARPLGLALLLSAAGGAPTRAAGQATFEAPLWAYPVRPAGPPAPRPDSVQPLRVPGSRRTFTAAQVAHRFGIPDWFPSRHPRMPPVVAVGRRPAVQACAYCHLADGRGRPENASLAGLPAAYIATQMAELKSGARRPAVDGVSPAFDVMRAVAEHATAEEVAEAARYFAALPPGKPRTRVVETDSVPRLRRLTGVHAVDGPNDAPLGGRLLDAATDAERHELHDPTVSYVTFAPRGSVARGRAIAKAGTPASPRSCASCHGATLRGVGAVPPIAGRAPSYVLRQLLAFRAGTRSSAAAAPMRDVAAGLTLDDMIAASAYVGTLRP